MHTAEYYKSMTWRSYDGRAMKFDEMDGDYLSNIYWYLVLVLDNKNPFILQAIQEVMMDRFNMGVMQYIPNPDVPDEERTLRARGYVRSDNTIWYEGRCIGQLRSRRKLLLTL